MNGVMRVAVCGKWRADSVEYSSLIISQFLPYIGCPCEAGILSLRKEVIQPHVPVRLPCYDFTPLTRHTFGAVLLCRLDKRLRVPPTRVV